MISNPDSNPPGELYCPSCEKNFHSGERCPNDGVKLVRLRGRKDPFIGRDLDGRYTVLEKLGAGGMGAVYRANQHSVSREVAVKVVGNLVAEPDVIKRFLREAKLASKLVHPNAVSVLDFGQTDDGLFYLVMELVNGLTLDAVLDRDGVFSPERVVRIGTQVCDALECAHALSVVHRDLKPANIMVLAHGRDLIKVLDFGLAKSLSPDQTSMTMTGAGAMLGTPAFMPPELATGQRCDGRADLYSLGCILYLLGTGRLPFESDSIHELIAMHGMEPAPPMRNVPIGLARVVDRLLAKHPGDRFQTAAETREALEDCLDSSRATIYDSYPAVGTPSPIMALASAATVPGAVPMHTPLPVRHDSGPVALPKRRRWPWFALGGALLGGAIAIAIVATHDEPAAATPEKPEPRIAPDKQAEVKPPAPPHEAAGSAAPAKSAVEDRAEPTDAKSSELGSASPAKAPTPPHVKPHPPKTVKSVVAPTPPPPTPPPAPPPQPPPQPPPTHPDEPKLPF